MILRQKLKISLGVAIILGGGLTHSIFALSLSEAKALASNQNRYVLAAQQKLVSAKAKELGAWPTVLPNVTLQGSGTQLNSYQNRVAAEAFGNGASNLFPDRTYSAKVSVTQPVFNPSIIAAFSAASAGSQASKFQLDYISQGVLLDTIVSYLNVSRASEMDRLASENIVVLTALLRQVSEMARLGAVTRSDALAVEVRLKEAERTKLNASKASMLSKMQLNLVLGNSLDTPVTVDAALDLPTVYTEMPSDISALVERGIQNRSDLKALQKANELLNSSVILAKTGFLPGVYLIGNYGYAGFNTSFLKEENRDWNVTLSASWNLFDGFGTTSKLQDAQAQVDENSYQIQAARQAIQLEIMDAVLSLGAAQKSLQLAQVSLELSQRQFLEVNERYKAGGATNNDVLAAELNLAQSKVGLLNAQYDAVIARAKLDKSVGVIH